MLTVTLKGLLLVSYSRLGPHLRYHHPHLFERFILIAANLQLSAVALVLQNRYSGALPANDLAIYAHLITMSKVLALVEKRAKTIAFTVTQKAGYTRKKVLIAWSIVSYHSSTSSSFHLVYALAAGT